jgi:hypothetical protein
MEKSMSKAQENAAFPGYTMDMDTKRVSFQEGMALRDYFAAKAMMGFLNCYHNPKEFTEQKLAEMSYEVADAMLKARGQA